MKRSQVEVFKAIQLAKLFGLNVQTIYRHAKKQELPALRVGRRWLFPKRAIYQWLKTGKKPKMIAKEEDALRIPKALPLFE